MPHELLTNAGKASMMYVEKWVSLSYILLQPEYGEDQAICGTERTSNASNVRK
jgi:hypothetical protein